MMKYRIIMTGTTGTAIVSDNYLAGAKCPKCKSNGPFTIEVKCLTTVTDDGLDDTVALNWRDNEACCLCLDCGYSAKFGAFKK